MNAHTEISNNASFINQPLNGAYARIGKSWDLKEASFKQLSIKRIVTSNAKIKKTTMKNTNTMEDSLQVLIKGMSKANDPINLLKKYAINNDLPNPELIGLNGKKLVSANDITEDNFLQWGELYNVNLNTPEKQYKIISSSIINKKNAEILVPKNYRAINVRFNGHSKVPNLKIKVGSTKLEINAYDKKENSFQWVNGFQNLTENSKIKHLGSIPISFQGDCNINFEIKCELSKTMQIKWQQDCYKAIISGYRLMQNMEETEVLWNPNLVGLPLKRQAS